MQRNRDCDDDRTMTAMTTEQIRTRTEWNQIRTFRYDSLTKVARILTIQGTKQTDIDKLKPHPLIFVKFAAQVMKNLLLSLLLILSLRPAYIKAKSVGSLRNLLGNGIVTRALKICVKAREMGVSRPLRGATVTCVDENIFTNDENLVKSTTGRNGCVTLKYKEEFNLHDYVYDQRPDIQCTITKKSYYPIVTDTARNLSKKRYNFGTVTMFPDRVSRVGMGRANGCGPVMLWTGIDGINEYIKNFTAECNNHDLCFEKCGETRSGCDNEFKKMMHSKCNDNYKNSDSRTACKSVANGMYKVVKAGGRGAWRTSQSRARCKTSARS